MKMAATVGRPGAAYRPAVKFVTILCVLLFLYFYKSTAPPSGSLSAVARGAEDIDSAPARRHLLFSEESSQLLGDDDNGDDDDDDDDDDQTNCTLPRAHKGYNDSCSFVLDNCGDQYQLFNYLQFVLCDLASVQWLGYIMLGLWLLLLISLLATTADNFFVPPLNLLSEKMKLSPSIAGITLLAIGNGAPDVFVAYSGLQQGNIELVLGALIGASIFISSVVLGTIILIVDVKGKDIDKIDFVRDVVAYILVVALVIGVAYDGTVKLVEAVSFLVFYILYIAVTVAIGYIRGFVDKRKKLKEEAIFKDSEDSPLVKSIQSNRETQSNSVRESVDQEIRSMNGSEVDQKERLELLGLTWPRESSIPGKIQFIIEWPFSVIRWASVPPCYYDGKWSVFHFIFAVISPIPMAAILTITIAGWSGFYDIYMGKLPLFAFLVLVGLVFSVVFFFVLSWKKPPHWTVQIVLGVLAFIMSIAWLNIEANEVVNVLNAFGLSFNIDPGILGLTVLAIGNSVGDWVADTAVARAGKPGMGIASCFGSPLLNDVLGLSIALIAKIGIYDHGKPFKIDVHAHTFLKVKMSWIFLGISLLSSIIIFPLFRFSPPKPFGAALIYLYVVFMVFSLLNETDHLNIDFLK